MAPSPKELAPIRISHDHPALPGHFPGQPIVPGVVILDQVRQQLALTHPGQQVTGIKKLKFLERLNPGEPFTIEFSSIKPGSVRFLCRATESGERLAEGHFKTAE